MEWGMIFVLMIIMIAVTTALTIHKRSIRHSERALELEVELEKAKQGERHARDTDTQKIEERLRVLERIATDPSADISRQIENLREIKADGEKVT